MRPKVGQVLQPVSLAKRVATTDPALAASEAVAAYLRGAVFRVWEGSGGIVREFDLARVYDEWPDPQVDLVYPSASVTLLGAGTVDASSFTPQAIETTWDEFGPGTVLWKSGELVATLQLDFWTTNAPEREAIAAALPGLFAPHESARRVLLAGPETYWSLPIRAELESYERGESSASAFQGERRMIARVRATADVVELRCGSLLSPSVELVVLSVAEDEEG